MKRSPLLRKRLWRPKPRPEAERVTPEQAEATFRRDGQCVLSLYEPHECRDRWGVPHRPDDFSKLTIEHFWPDYAVKGKRGPLLATLCASINIGAPSKAQRDILRAHVAKFEQPK